MKAHVLDATYELFRHWFGVPPRSAPDGREVGAVYGALGSVLSLLRQPEVTHLGAAADHVIESFRNELYAGYKTGAGIDPALRSQFSLLEEGLEAIGVLVWPMVEFEADDGIATAAARLAADDRVSQVVILSPDKDMSQCVVGDRVVTHDRRQRKTYNADGVREKFGVSPESIPDWLGLVGDAADGIPGVPAWGAKSSATVLTRYGHVADIPGDAADWDIKVRGAKRLATSLAAHREEAALWVKLAILRTDAPIPCELEDLEWRGVPRARFEAFCHRCGFTELRNRPHRWA